MMIKGRTTPIRLHRRAALAGLAAVLAAPAARAGAVNGCIVGRDGWLFADFDDVRRSSPVMIGRVTKTIAAAIAALGAAHIEVALSLTPAKSRVYRDFLPPDMAMAPESVRRYALAYDALRSSGAIVFDQANFFDARRKAAPGEDLFFKADTHWVAVGAAAAATEMARQIKLHGQLPASPQPGVTLSPPKPVLQQRNDLALLLPPAERANYPFQSYMAREPVAASAQAALLGDDGYDTLVIGNSFMQPAYGYAATLSSELDRPVGLAWKVHQFSPYWMLLDTLRGAAFRAQRPKLIVWNFQESDMETPSDLPGVWGPNGMSPTDFLTELRRLLAA